MARNRPPSFDLYPDDLIAGTMHLHPICMGMYVRLLCFQWSHGAIPTDRRQLMQVTGALPEELDQHLSLVLEKFEKCDDGALRNARLERERAKKALVSEARAIAANARWVSHPEEKLASAHDANADANADANSHAKHMHPIGRGKREVGSRKKASGSRKKEVKLTTGEWVVPEKLDTQEVRQLLSEFEEMRRAVLKVPVIDRNASSKILKHFDNAEHLAYALEQCIANNWQGLDPKYRKDATANSKRGSKLELI